MLCHKWLELVLQKLLYYGIKMLQTLFPTVSENNSGSTSETPGRCVSPDVPLSKQAVSWKGYCCGAISIRTVPIQYNSFRSYHVIPPLAMNQANFEEFYIFLSNGTIWFIERCIGTSYKQSREQVKNEVFNDCLASFQDISIIITVLEPYVSS